MSVTLYYQRYNSMTYPYFVMVKWVINKLQWRVINSIIIISNGRWKKKNVTLDMWNLNKCNNAVCNVIASCISFTLFGRCRNCSPMIEFIAFETAIVLVNTECICSHQQRSRVFQVIRLQFFSRLIKIDNSGNLYLSLVLSF